MQDLIDAIFANPGKFSTQDVNRERGIIIMTMNSLDLSESHEFSKPGLHLLNMRLKAKDSKDSESTAPKAKKKKETSKTTEIAFTVDRSDKDPKRVSWDENTKLTMEYDTAEHARRAFENFATALQC